MGLDTMIKNAVSLLVEDNQVHVAKTGLGALDYLFGKEPYDDRTVYPLPDFILLDLKLPGIDGQEVLRRVKATPILCRIPVIILTSSQEQVDMVQSYDGGANRYLVKPVSFGGFLKVVAHVQEYWLILNSEPPIH